MDVANHRKCVGSLSSGNRNHGIGNSGGGDNRQGIGGSRLMVTLRDGLARRLDGYRRSGRGGWVPLRCGSARLACAWLEVAFGVPGRVRATGAVV
jgi:hypothetical protein